MLVKRIQRAEGRGQGRVVVGQAFLPPFSVFPRQCRSEALSSTCQDNWLLTPNPDLPQHVSLSRVINEKIIVLSWTPICLSFLSL